MKNFKLSLLASLTLVSTFALAQTAPQTPKPQGAEQEQGKPEHRKPPPEALAACKALSAGAACSFTSPRGPETGDCAAPEGKPLACRPKHGDHPNGPPPKKKAD
jgi:hypothetical protein